MSDEDAQPLTDEVADAGPTAADGLMARMRLNAGPADGWRQGWLKLKVKKKAQKAYFDSCGYRLNWYGSKPDTDGAKPSGGLDLRDVERLAAPTDTTVEVHAGGGTVHVVVFDYRGERDAWVRTWANAVPRSALAPALLEHANEYIQEALEELGPEYEPPLDLGRTSTMRRSLTLSSPRRSMTLRASMSGGVGSPKASPRGSVSSTPVVAVDGGDSRQRSGSGLSAMQRKTSKLEMEDAPPAPPAALEKRGSVVAAEL
tara:strand:+ start:3221 stop:3994 length:774 start_codon:yes stop_codon:yes gene_type:complete